MTASLLLLLLLSLAARTVLSSEFIEYYGLLGVDRDVATSDLKRIFRKRSVELHPDKNKSADAVRQFQGLREAFDCISDPSSREYYDVNLRGELERDEGVQGEAPEDDAAADDAAGPSDVRAARRGGDRGDVLGRPPRDDPAPVLRVGCPGGVRRGLGPLLRQPPVRAVPADGAAREAVREGARVGQEGLAQGGHGQHGRRREREPAQSLRKRREGDTPGDTRGALGRGGRGPGARPAE
ncbi:hypothetical protein THAOC_00025, partial [Thalassiosira oceanica]